MQKYLIAIAVFLLTAHASYSCVPLGTDTIPSSKPEVVADMVWVPKGHLENALRMRDSFLLMQQQSRIEHKIMDSTTAALRICDLQNNKLEGLDTINQARIHNYELQGQARDQQIRVMQIYTKELKGEIKRKNWMIAKISTLSITVVGTLTYLLIKHK